jgi:signal transduction histidine kinase
MECTHHFKQRMKRMVDLALDYGKLESNDKYVLRQKDAVKLLSELQDSLRHLKKIIDKGGVTVVVNGESLITTYNCDNQN